VHCCTRPACVVTPPPRTSFSRGFGGTCANGGGTSPIGAEDHEKLPVNNHRGIRKVITNGKKAEAVE
jgi:hypothetical protein